MGTVSRPTVDPSLDHDARALYEALSSLVRVYQFRDRDRICCHDVSVAQCYALESLIGRGPLSLNALAAELYLDKSTASRVVDALERKDYARRAVAPDDARVRLISATAAGRRLHARIEAEILAEERALLADFPPAVRRAMTELVRRLGRAAVARAGGEPSCCAAS